MTACSLTEFARRHGVSKPAVTKWKERGWIVFIGENVDVEASDEMLAKYRKQPPIKRARAVNQPVNRAAVNTERLTVEEGDSPTVAAAKIIALTGADMDFEEARRVKENYLALLNKLEYEQKDGSLIAVQLAEQVLFEGARQARDAWLNFPARIGPMLAATLGIEADKVTEALTPHVHKQIADLGEPEGEFVKR